MSHTDEIPLWPIITYITKVYYTDYESAIYGFHIKIWHSYQNEIWTIKAVSKLFHFMLL